MKTSKKKTIVIVAGAVLLFGLSSYLSREESGKMEVTTVAPNHAGGQVEAKPHNLDPDGLETPYDMRLTSILGEPKGAGLEERLYQQRLREAMRRSINTMNHPVIIFGLAVDQEGVGIPEVRVNLHTKRLFRKPDNEVNEGGFEFSVLTDSAGRFNVSGFNAEDISLLRLEKAGYVQAESNLKRHATQFGDWGSFENPIIFRMWHSQGAEPLITSATHFFKRIPTDGTVLEADLLSGDSRRVETPVRIRLTRDDDTMVADKRGYRINRYDWSFELEVPDGGVILTETEQAFFAPEEGYRKTASITMKTEDNNWSRSKDINAYIVTGNPARYSRAHFSIQAEDGHDSGKLAPRGTIRWQFYTNPTGSRNLEFDPALRIALHAQ